MSESNQGWSKEPPTEPGWYWWRPDMISESEIVKCAKREQFVDVCRGGMWSFSEALRGDWWPERIQEPLR